MTAESLPLLTLDRDALTVAMAVAPGVYARNRMFALYREPAVQEARARASTVRGIVRQLASERRTATALRLIRTASGAVLEYRIECLKIARRVELTNVEAACLSYLASRAGVTGLPVTAEDRALLAGTLQKLALGLELELASAAT